MHVPAMPSHNNISREIQERQRLGLTSRLYWTFKSSTPRKYWCSSGKVATEQVPCFSYSCFQNALPPLAAYVGHSVSNSGSRSLTLLGLNLVLVQKEG